MSETYLKFDKRLTPKLEKAPKPAKLRKPISKIGKRAKDRMKEFGTETELFRKIWESRERICAVCGQNVPVAKPSCFSHRLGKGRYPEHRYNEKNVDIVCGEECHHENDRRNAHRDAEILQEILS